MFKKQRRKLKLSHQDDLPCDELRPDDGLHPRDLVEKEHSPNDRRKDRQLCKQVFQALSMEVACLQYRPWARDMYVQAVEPAPDASRLQVSVSFFTPREPDSAVEALGRLRAMTSSLRLEVGSAICRKKVPELIFDITVEAGEWEVQGE